MGSQTGVGLGGKKDRGWRTGSFLCPGRDPGAPKGAKWAAEKDGPRSDGAWGRGNEEAEDSTIRE